MTRTSNISSARGSHLVSDTSSYPSSSPPTRSSTTRPSPWNRVGRSWRLPRGQLRLITRAPPPLRARSARSSCLVALCQRRPSRRSPPGTCHLRLAQLPRPWVRLEAVFDLGCLHHRGSLASPVASRGTTPGSVPRRHRLPQHLHQHPLPQPPRLPPSAVAA